MQPHAHLLCLPILLQLSGLLSRLMGSLCAGPSIPGAFACWYCQGDRSIARQSRHHRVFTLSFPWTICNAMYLPSERRNHGPKSGPKFVVHLVGIVIWTRGKNIGAGKKAVRAPPSLACVSSSRGALIWGRGHPSSPHPGAPSCRRTPSPCHPSWVRGAVQPWESCRPPPSCKRKSHVCITSMAENGLRLRCPRGIPDLPLTSSAGCINTEYAEHSSPATAPSHEHVCLFKSIVANLYLGLYRDLADS